MGGPVSEQALIQASQQEKNPAVKHSTLQSLGMVAGPEGMKEVQRAQGDSDPMIRQKAAEIMKRRSKGAK